jgi:hypothetical protein
MTGSDSVPSGQLTTTAPITWDKLSLSEGLSLNVGLSNTEFQVMHNCAQRMLGRGIGKISNLRFQLMPAPGHLVAVAVCIIPQQAGAAAAPVKMEHLAAAGACFLHYSPYGSSLTGSPSILPGVNMQVKGPTTTLLSGAPPHLYFFLEAKKLDGSNPDGATKFYIQAQYDLDISGYDFLKPF